MFARAENREDSSSIISFLPVFKHLIIAFCLILQHKSMAGWYNLCLTGLPLTCCFLFSLQVQQQLEWGQCLLLLEQMQKEKRPAATERKSHWTCVYPNCQFNVASMIVILLSSLPALLVPVVMFFFFKLIPWCCFCLWLLWKCVWLLLYRLISIHQCLQKAKTRTDKDKVLNSCSFFFFFWSSANDLLNLCLNIKVASSLSIKGVLINNHY